MLFDDRIDEGKQGIEREPARCCVFIPPATFEMHIILETEGIGISHCLDGEPDEGLAADEVAKEPVVRPPLCGGPGETLVQHGRRMGMQESDASLLLALLVPQPGLRLASEALSAAAFSSLLGHVT